MNEQPGKAPFTRGIHSQMYRTKLWTMRQYSGYASAEETNNRFKKMLQQGQSGLSVAFDLPTQMGYDSDHSLSSGEVGRVGVAIDTIDDMLKLFDGIPLDKVSTSMTINATAHILLALYVSAAAEQGVSPDKLNGTVQNDILKEYIARGTYIYPPIASMRLTADIMRYCKQNVPNWNTISISGYHIREAGSTAVQELAFTLANGIEYVNNAISVGLHVDEFAPKLSFFFNSHLDLFEEVAKFRAARRMWCNIMQKRFNAKNEKSWMLRFHTQTAGSSLTAQQPLVNVVRTTIEGLAAVLGGTQSLHTNSFDEALGLPTEASASLALRTQQVIGFESGVTKEPDPLGGSYFIEKLTDEIESAALAELAKIDEMGGALKAISNRYYQDQIAASAYQYQKQIESEERIVVGVNKFRLEHESNPEIMIIPPQAEMQQIERLTKFKAERSPISVNEALNELTDAAKNAQAPIMELVVKAVQSRCTLGEISDVLRAVWGEHLV